MTGTTAPSPGVLRTLWNWLPSVVGRRVLVLAWLTLVTQMLIVATGGAVRLTGSGLGCPTWPLCTDASLISTPEMGMHGVIEFGNRVLSIIVGIVAVALVIGLLRLRARRDLFVPAIAILALTVLQGFVGGISVRLQLDPMIVGVHFVASVVLVSLASMVVFRAHHGPGGAPVVPRWLRWVAYLTAGIVALTVVVGVLTTGSGPHAGDDATARNGLDPVLLQHVHSWPAYATVALTVALVTAAIALRVPIMTRFAVALLAIEVVQVAVGLAQSRMGLPPLLVGTHMVLSCVLVATMTAVVLSLRSREG